MVASAEFRRVFAAFDQDGDDKISEAELWLCMKAALGGDMSAEEVQALMATADTDGDGFLDEEEFVRLVEETVAGTHEEDGERCREAFGMYEMEGRGCITPQSLELMMSRLGLQLDADECEAMIRRFDLNGDGVLTFDEFKTMMVMS
jgi:calcium-binding protein CML